jgi:hypothetical protein
VKFLDLLAVIGLILALAAALDFLAKQHVKLRFAQFINSSSGPYSQINYGITPILDKIFGKRLASPRAIWVSIGVSLSSLALTYWFAYITSDTSVTYIFPYYVSSRSVGIFILFLAGCVVGDFFSFAQTRVFLRAVDGLQKGVISVGLALADAVISLAIFVGIFSVTRLLAYLIIIGTTPQGVIQQEKNINTAALRYAINEIRKDGIARPSEVGWSSYLSNIKSPEDVSIADEVARRYTNDLVKMDRSKDIVSVSVTFACVTNIYKAIADGADVSTLISREIAASRGLEEGGLEYDHVLKDVSRRVKSWTPSDQGCIAPTLTIKQNLTPAGLLSVSGIANAFFASFERTLFDFYTNLGFKLAPYAYVDPNNDIGAFYASLIQQTQYGLLGTVPSNRNIQYALSEFAYKSPKNIETLRIPFSPMLASCLTISIVFMVYVAIVYLSRATYLLQSTLLVVKDKFNIETAPFTFVALGMTIISMTMFFVSNIVSYAWSLFFGSFI